MITKRKTVKPFILPIHVCKSSALIIYIHGNGLTKTKNIYIGMRCALCCGQVCSLERKQKIRIIDIHICSCMTGGWCADS